MNKSPRSAFAVVISLSLVLLAPGGTAWAQAARIVTPSAGGSLAGSMGAAGAVSAVHFAAPGLVNLAPSAPSLTLPSGSPRVGVSAVSPASARAEAVIRVEAVIVPALAASAAAMPSRVSAPHTMFSAPTAERAPPVAAKMTLETVSAAVAPARASVQAAIPTTLNRFFDGRAKSDDSVAVNAVKETAAARSGLKKSMPEEPTARPDEGPDSTDGLDGLGNPQRRGGEVGPDDRSDPDTGGDRGGNSELFSMMSPSWVTNLGAAGRFLGTWAGSALLVGAGLGVGVLTHAITPAFFVVAPLYAAFIVPSLILHEMGHAKAADKLGDPTARLQGRLGWSVRDLMSHISPLMTVAVPLLTLAFTGMLFGGAVPVQVNERNLARPTSDMAKIALAGPAVNFGLALAGAAVAAGLAAAGIGGMALTAAGSFVLFNVMLGVFNLLPFFPLDGHHIVRHVIKNWFKAPGAADWLERHSGVQVYGLVLTLIYGGALVGSLISGVTGALLLPAAMLVGTLFAQLPMAGPSGSEPIAAVASMPDSKLLLVRLEGTQRPLGSDIHLGLVDVTKRGGMKLFSTQLAVLAAELEAAGLGMSALAAYGAAPVASYQRINTATIRVPLAASESFRADMVARGFKVYENSGRSIVRPIEDTPGFSKAAIEPSWGAISMKDTLKLSTADKVHEIARKRWGDPGVGWRAGLARSLLRLLGDAPAQPKIGVIDTGVDIEHPLVKPGLAGHKDIRPDGNGIDDDGHGTWVTSMVLNYAPWLKSITHYKAFVNGNASLDDVLKGLTMAANDGNIIISNSWGDDGGDPASPDSLMTKKLGEEGRIMVFAAGNNGYSGANTVGSPAIASAKDPKTGALRVIAVAATDSKKRVTSFSSKGPGSAVTKTGGEWANYPRKPDAAEQGNDTEGAWRGGGTRAISGTSMSTPKFAGTLALLAMMFGVTETGEKLDRIVNAVMSTLTNELNQSEAAIGSGFSAAKAAFDKLAAEGMSPAAPGWVSRLALWIVGGAK